MPAVVVLGALLTVLPANDLRFALRSLGRYRLTTVAILASLVLGLTTTSGVFGLLYATLVRPLPFERPERLVRVLGVDVERGLDETGISPALFPVLAEARLETIDELAAVVADPELAFDVRVGGGDVRRVRGAVVSAGLFDLLGVDALRGRTFDGAEADAVVVSASLWRTLVGSRASADRVSSGPTGVGEILHLNGRPFSVVGILPGGLGYPAGVEVWVAGPERAPELRDLALFYQVDYDVVGRLAPGASREAAEAELRGIYEASRAGYPAGAAMASSVRVESLHESLTGGARRPLVLLQAGVAAILAICCANVAGLLLVRTNRRRRELAIRSTLGARPVHLLRQLAVELLLLFAAGGLLSLLAGRWVLGLVTAVAPAEWLAYARVETGPAMVAATLGLAFACAVIAGLVPIASALRPELVRVAKPGAFPGSSAGSLGSRRRGVSFGRSVVVGEIALAVALLVGAGLVTRSLGALHTRELGVSTGNVLMARVTLLKSRHPDREERARWIAGLERALRETPRVEAVGATQFFFMTEGAYVNTVTAWSGPSGVVEATRSAAAAYVTPGYFEALGIPVLAGRSTDPLPVHRGAPEVVVGRALARELWPSGDAVGERLEFEGRWWEVVGVVGDVRSPRIADGEAPELFLPRSQAMIETGELTYLIRGSGPASITPEAVRSAIRAFDPDQAPGRIEPLPEVVGRELAPQRYASLLLAVFSALAVVLAAVGIYGVVAHAVGDRTRELGTRRAVGATSGHILGEVLGSSARLGLVGAALGALLGALFGRGLESLLFGVSLWDAPSWAVGLLLGFIVPVLAALAPARRACRVDPAVVLRES